MINQEIIFIIQLIIQQNTQGAFDVQHKYLLDIASTQTNQRFPAKFEKCSCARIGDKDYIIFDGYISERDPMSKKTPVACYSDGKCLAAFLNIGKFVHCSMTKTYSNITSRLVDGDIQKSRLYEPLTIMIIDFSKKFGNFEPLKDHVYDQLPKECLKRIVSEFASIDRWHGGLQLLSVNSFIQKASHLYLMFRDFEEDNDYIYSQAELLRLEDLAANVVIAPTIAKIKGKRKIKLDYEFWAMIDLLKYQLLISLMGDCSAKIGHCQFCGTVFASARRLKFCSRSCANRSSANKPFEQVKTCLSCGEPFKPERQNERYCSDTCKRKRNNATAKERKAAK